MDLVENNSTAIPSAKETVGSEPQPSLAGPPWLSYRICLILGNGRRKGSHLHSVGAQRHTDSCWRLPLMVRCPCPTR